MPTIANVRYYYISDFKIITAIRMLNGFTMVKGMNDLLVHI